MWLALKMITKLLFILIIFEASVVLSITATSVKNNKQLKANPTQDKIPKSQDNEDDMPEILKEEIQRVEETNTANITFLEEFSKDISKYNITERGYGPLIHILPYLRFNVSEYTFGKFMTIISNIFPLQVNTLEINLPFYFYIQASVEYLLTITRSYENIQKDWIIKVWRPFEEDIIGIALYKDYTGNSIIREIYRNQSEININTVDLEVAAYVPPELLENLIKSGLNKKEDLTIVMTIMNGQKFKGLWRSKDDMTYIVGIKIPDYCKYDNIPLIKVFFKDDTKAKGSNWIEFGNNYVDVPRYVKALCFTSKLLFFGQSETTKAKYFESITHDYCNVTQNGVTVINRLDFSFPGSFCLDKHGRLQQRSFCVVKKACYNDLPVSNKTQLFYEMLLQCTASRNSTYCFESFLHIADSAWMEADVMIGTQISRYIEAPNHVKDSNKKDEIKNKLLGLFEKAVGYIAKDKSPSQILKLTSLFKLITRGRLITDDYTFIYPNLLYQRFKRKSPIVGSVFYKTEDPSQSFNVKPLYAGNVTARYSSDDNVDIVVSVSKPCPESTGCDLHGGVCNLFVINDNLTVYQNETCTSKIVTLFCDSYEAIDFNVYFRDTNVQEGTIEYGINKGYYIVQDVHTMMFVMYLSQTNDNVPSNHLNIYEETYDNNNGYDLRLKNKIVKEN